MNKNNLPALACVSLLVFVSACQSLEGKREGEQYHAPAGAYTMDLSINTFRGEVLLDERCTRTGGSTTFWDGNGRMFRIDYQQAENNPMIDVPRFASDLTLLNLTLNTYLRKVVAKSDKVRSADAAHQEFLRDTSPRSLFAVVSLNVDSGELEDKPEVEGTYYYGFLVFKEGQRLFVLQHRQPVLSPEKMKTVLLRLADEIEIPGKKRDDTELERMRRMLIRLAPGEPPVEDPVRLCEPVPS
jgi:hypothetical protein